MDGSHILLIIIIAILFFIILITLLNRSNAQGHLLQSLFKQLKALNDEVADLTKELRNNQTGQGSQRSQTSQPYQQQEAPPAIPAKPVEEKKEPPRVIPVVNEPVIKKPGPFAAFTTQEDEHFEIPKKVRHEKKKNTDLEKFIGENLANKIGIAVLVLGIAFFIKYAIDKNWINEAGRVMVGLLCGGILIGFAHYLRNTYRSFSSVLVGGGLTVFYFSVAFAFHQYQLIGQTAAFIFMVIIAGLGVVLSLFYNRQELAILATIGGFITPFLVSTGEENYIALFTYLCILNAGLMALAWFKRWPAINTIALFFTTIIYGGWLIDKTVFEDKNELPYANAFLFATLFYISFVVMNIINTLRLKDRFNAFDFIILLSTNFLYYAAGMVILGYWGGRNGEGIFTAGLGLVNLGLAAFFYPRKQVDRNFVSLLIGLAITFLSLTAPVQFRGNHIVLFWAAETVVLYWLYLRSGIKQLKYGSVLLALLMVSSLILTWTQVYFSSNGIAPIIANKAFITALVAAASLFIYARLTKNDNDSNFLPAYTTVQMRALVVFMAIVVAYFAGLLEIYYQFSTRYTLQAPVHVIYMQLYSFTFAVVLFRFYRNKEQYALLKFIFTALAFAFYVTHLVNTYDISLELLLNNKGALFIAHWLAAALLLWMLYDLVLFVFKDQTGKWSVYRPSFTWIASAGIILLLSVEMYHVMLWTNYRDDGDWVWWENLYYKAGLSILWGLCSFAMMWIGMKKNFRTLRLISLTLFTITIIKLFLVDIRNIPPGGKIAAFILLGVLLLAVSFMYQRLKKIIIDNTTE